MLKVGRTSARMFRYNVHGIGELPKSYQFRVMATGCPKRRIVPQNRGAKTYRESGAKNPDAPTIAITEGGMAKIRRAASISLGRGGAARDLVQGFREGRKGLVDLALLARGEMFTAESDLVIRGGDLLGN